MGGKALEPGEALHRVFDDEDGTAGLDDSGYILEIHATTGEVSKCTAGASGVPYGIAFMDTLNPLYDGTTKYSQYLEDPELAVIYDGVIDVRVSPNAARTKAIDFGSEIALSPSEDGECEAATESTPGPVIGTAEEALAVTADPTDGDQKILVRVRIPYK